MNEENKPNNPLAFPQPLVNVDGMVGSSFGENLGGMTLRDYFAAKAMQALITEGDRLSTVATEENMPITVTAAKMAYAMSDAMLEEREK